MKRLQSKVFACLHLMILIFSFVFTPLVLAQDNIKTSFFRITPAIYSSQFILQSTPQIITPATKQKVSVTFKNIGRVAWRNDSFVLCAIYNSWKIRQITLLRHEVIKPGESKTFTFEITSPSKKGSYNFQWQMAKLEGRRFRFFGQKSNLVVIKVNSPPVINPIDNQTSYEHKILQFKVSAQDKDNDTLNYSASNLPQGASFDKPTQTFSWTPQHGQKGTYPNIHFEVTDGINSVSKEMTADILKTVVFGTIYTKDISNQAVPLEGVNIDIMDLTRTNIIVSGTTDATGHFDVFYQTWTDGTYIIRASKTGYKTYYGMATLRGNSMMPFSITMLRAILFGTIYEKDQNNQNISLQGATVEILNLAKTQTLASATTDTRGYFDIATGLFSDGTYYIKTSKQGYKTYYGVATLRNNSSMPFSVTLLKEVSCQITSITPEDLTQFLAGAAINIKINASSSGTLEYQFSVGGTIKQAWSSSNSYTWQTSEADTGPVNITCQIRDSNGGADSKTITYNIINPTIEQVLQKVADNYALINDKKMDVIVTSQFNSEPEPFSDPVYTRHYFKKLDKQRTEFFSSPERLDSSKTEIQIINGPLSCLMDPVSNTKVYSNILNETNLSLEQLNGMDEIYHVQDFLNNHTIVRNDDFEALRQGIVKLNVVPIAEGLYSKLELQVDYFKGLQKKISTYIKENGQDKLIESLEIISSGKFLNSVWLPTMQRKALYFEEGNLFMNFEYSNIYLNTGLGDSLFDMGEE